MIRTSQDWSGRIKTGQERSEMGRNGHDWSGMLRTVQEGSGMIQTGQEGSGLVWNDHDWSKMI